MFKTPSLACRKLHILQLHALLIFSVPFDVIVPAANFLKNPTYSGLFLLLARLL
jgi:hypothetical protein